MRIAQRLATLVLLAMLPLVLLEMLDMRDDRRTERAEIAAVAERTANRAAAEQERIVDGVRQLLTALAQIPSIQVGDVARCNLTVSRLHRQFDMYMAMGVADTSGRIWCSSPRRNLDISDRVYFKRALEEKTFDTGGYIVGRLNGRPSLNFNMAVQDGEGRVTGVVVAGLDLHKLAQSLRRTPLPPATRLAIIGPDRRIMVSLPEGEGVGRLLPDQLEQAFTAKAPGVLDTRWLDGSERVIAYAPPNTYAGLPFLVAIGTDKAIALQRVEHRTWLRALSLGVTVLIALLLTWLFASRFVSRPMRRLTAAVLAWQRGERSARVGRIGDGGEFDALAGAYDELAAGYAERHRRLYDALESTTDSVMTVAPDWSITFLNARARARLGEDAARGNLWKTFPEIEHSWAGRMLRDAMAERHPLGISLEYPPLDGHFQVNALPLDDGHLMLFIREVTEQHRAQDELRRLALSDALTGLPNRANTMNLARMKLAENRLAALLLIDLDGFKHVNDSFGHPVGDSLLQQVAERLRLCCAGSSVIGRLGGDEFIALVDRDDCRGTALAEELLAALSEGPFRIGDRLLRVAGSCGVIVVPERTHGSVEELFANADLALYRAKAEGGGRVHCHTHADREAYETRRRLEDEIERAAAHSEFELFFQPQVRLHDGVTVGAEALLRWRHPERGLLSPAEFIDVLSSGPHASTVGAWVLEEACRQAALWWRSGHCIRVAINLFPDQVKGHDLAALVRDALSRHALPPEALEIEVTEAVALSEEQGTRENLVKLRMLGVWLALDDFGTGFASLATLKELEVDRLKIDCGFVSQLPYNAHDRAIVEAVLALARTLDLEVIAEGVERAEQEAYLRASGCHEAQGYRYSAPVPAAGFDRMLEAGHARAAAAAT